MNSLRNKVNLIGRLGKNPEIRTLNGGKMMAKFTLATNETYKTENGEKKTETQWHNLIVWGGQAQVVEKYFRKGQEIAVEGKLSTRVYEDKSGTKRFMTEIVVNDFVMLGGKNQD
jgi:single-strand DNA-binding protein